MYSVVLVPVESIWPGCGSLPWLDSWLWNAKPICLMLFEQLMRLAASRTFCTAGTNRPTNTAMMAITTSNSISVKAERLARL